MLLRLASITAAAIAVFPAFAQSTSDLVQAAQSQLPALTEIYKHLHENPELSRQEEHTSAFHATELRTLGYTVTEHVGK